MEQLVRNSWNEQETNLNGGTPADYERGVIFPTQTAGVHVRPQVDIISQNVGDSLLCGHVIDFYSLKKKKRK